MYGTIARIHPRQDRLDEFWAQTRAMGEAPMAGLVASYVFEPDHNPYPRPTMFLVALFEDEATYRANAASPAQDARFQQYRELLEDDPDWMDGTFRGV